MIYKTNPEQSNDCAGFVLWVKNGQNTEGVSFDLRKAHNLNFYFDHLDKLLHTGVNLLTREVF
jgi:hypothetical protein